MGKDSLIKSTDKKAGGTKKAAKAPKKSPSKPQKTPAKKTAPTKAKAKTKAVNVKDLIFKKFEPLSKQKVMPPPKGSKALPAAPPFISATDPKEVQRLRKLLMAKFSMQEVKAAAKAPKAAAPPKPEPVEKSKPAAKAQPPKEAPAEPVQPKEAQPVQAPVEEVQPVIPTASTMDGDIEPDPMQKMIKYAIAGFALVILLIVGASAKNSAKYYVKSQGNRLEIWRGDFSPTGKSLFINLPGVQVPEDLKTVYSREEVYPMAFNYYIDKADSLLETTGLPDYEKIKANVHQASAFAINETMSRAVKTRLNTIDRMALLYKADVAISKSTPESLDNAMDDLNKALRLTDDLTQQEMIKLKIETTEKIKADLAAKAVQE
jgi:hypothetical protein